MPEAKWKKLETEQEVRQALRPLLGRMPGGTLWQHQVEEGRVQYVLDCWSEDNEEEELHSLARSYRADARLMTQDDQPGRRRVRIAPRSGPAPDATHSLAALAHIMARRAESHRLVVAFRERVLGGAPLPADEVDRWIDAHDQLWLCGDPELWPPEDARKTPWDAMEDAERYASGEYTHDDLDFLHCVADWLRDVYGWPYPDEVARFILGGEPPSLPPATTYVTRYRSFHPATARVCLEVSPLMDPKDVASTYIEMRRDLLGLGDTGRLRVPEEKVARLADFIDEHNDGSSWVAAWKAWSKAAPKEWRYADDRSFTRDARNAYRRVTGQELDWAGGSAGRKEES